MNGNTRKEKIKERLRQSFAALPLNARLPSDRELAERFGAAFLTVNRAMGELEREGYVLRVPRRGTFLASRERAAPEQADAAGIVFAYPDFFSYDYWARRQYASAAAARAGLRLRECPLAPDVSWSAFAARLRGRPGLRGLLLLPPPGSLTAAARRQLNALGCPVALLETPAPEAGLANLRAIANDWREGGRLLAAALLAAGRARLAYVAAEPDAGFRAEVAAGARAALAAAGLPGKRLTVLAAPQHAAWNDSRENAYRLALRAAELRFDGLIFSSLNGVKGAVRAFNELGLRVPGDVAYAAVGNGNGEELYMTPRPGSLVFDTRAAMEMAVAFVLSPETGVPRLRTVGATYTARDSA